MTFGGIRSIPKNMAGVYKVNEDFYNNLTVLELVRHFHLHKTWTLKPGTGTRREAEIEKPSRLQPIV